MMNIAKFSKCEITQKIIRELREFARIKPKALSYSRKFAQFADKLFWFSVMQNIIVNLKMFNVYLCNSLFV